ncbi:ribosome hibernation-promoting factor, HPF/YfiA family, partial [Staphylococcus aureus]|uniref:ribosome hibernation-promoting factor, HPF/YfiA family n=1 Tax=Staphylococcus aureus TaxID=1280 RepID=UPI00114CE615
NYIEEKIGKLERYFNHAPNASAHLKLKPYSNSATKIEVTIPFQPVTFRAEERHDDLYPRTDFVNTQLVTQVREYKTRITRKSRDRGDHEVCVAELQEMQETQVDNDAYDDNEIEIFR